MIEPPATCQPPAWQTSTNGRRFIVALLISLLAHALLLSLQFGGLEFGLPGFALPWHDRRGEAPDLRVLLVPPDIVAQPDIAAGSESVTVPAKLIESALYAGSSIVTFKMPDQPPAQPAPASRPQNVVTAESKPKPKIARRKISGILPIDLPANAPDKIVEPTVESSVAAFSDLAPLAKPLPPVIATELPEETEFVVPVAPSEPATIDSTIPENTEDFVRSQNLQAVVEQFTEKQAAGTEAALQETERDEAALIEAERQESIRQTAASQALAEQEAAHAEFARLEAERQENARQLAASQEAARIEAERQEIARQAAASQALAEQEATRAESARLEAERQENARQLAASQEAARIEAERQEIARQAAASQALAEQEATRAESAQLEAKREQDARRDAARRAMGRQLDAEATRRKAAEDAMPRSPSASSLRRGRLFGRTDPNTELILYANAWSQKIHFNTLLETIREVLKQTYTDPMVTVAIRSDGSVESITFVRSSGVAAIDDAIRHIVQSQTPYPPFQPALARDFDVIEIRRTWHFDSAVRLY